ncbi:MAG: cysteine peptidase family C39 domain-containing protein [Caldilineaceae bacterium]
MGIRHRRQHQADCLAACAAMVVDYLGVSIDEPRLRRLLGTTADGTPFPNITRLQTIGLSVTYGKNGDVARFDHYLDLGLPIIIGAKTLTWPHWAGEVTRHAVVVVGIDHDHGLIYIDDPFFADAPLALELLRFETGWEELDRQYAVIGLVPP